MNDPITFEVIRNALVAATDEMALALKRSAYSTNIKTRSDFSCAVFDADLRAVAQGFNQPVHLGSMVEQIPRAIRDYGPERLGPGEGLGVPRRELEVPGEQAREEARDVEVLEQLAQIARHDARLVELSLVEQDAEGGEPLLELPEARRHLEQRRGPRREGLDGWDGLRWRRQRGRRG